MERFLSPAWFALVATDSAADPADLVLQQVVTGTPDGEVRYQVSLRDGRATIHQGSPADADMTFSSDYQTAVAIAAGTLSTEAALTRGRIRISGNLARLDGHADALKGLDVLADVRALTCFDPGSGQPGEGGEGHDHA